MDRDVLLRMRLLKGAAFTILVYLSSNGARGLSCHQLARDLGFDDETVARHLQTLELMDLVTHPRSQEWYAVNHIDPSLLGNLFAAPQPTSPTEAQDGAADVTSVATAAPLTDEKAGKNPAFLPTTTTRSLSHDSRRSSSSPDPPKSGKIPLFDPELVRTFQSIGIGSNRWSELVSLEWMTPAYGAAIVAKTLNDPDPDKRTAGMAITRMLAHDPVPKVCSECGRKKGHKDGCTQKYKSWGNANGPGKGVPRPLVDN